MINIEILRENKRKTDLNFIKRGCFFNHLFFYEFDSKIKYLKKKLYNLNRLSNIIATLIKVYRQFNLNYSFLLHEIAVIKVSSVNIKKKLYYLEVKFNNFLLTLPNFLHNSVNYGLSVDDNLEIRSFRASKFASAKIIYDRYLNDPEFNKNYIDFELSSNISGSGFVILKNEIASLHRAVCNYMIDLHVHKHGYKEVISPLCVNEKSMYNTGHFPKFYNDQFGLSDTNLWLIPTAEVVLANIFSNSIIIEDELPIKLVSKTECFRKEKGSYGSKVKGLIRQHQFDKVELVSIVKPCESYTLLEELLSHAELVLQNLDLSYRVLSLCSFDTGFTSSKTYDLEVWFPKRKLYVEVASCSNTETFQAYRMGAKYRKLCSSLDYTHILNGSGLAVGRVLLAIIENNVDNDGNILIPDVLVKYMNGCRVIKYK
ncbi:MAG: serine--tRNA ligase [Candidatus Riesia sp.]|nr:serine--tRNA ligase [Candidatus Riesia sp.]